MILSSACISIVKAGIEVLIIALTAGTIATILMIVFMLAYKLVDTIQSLLHR